MTSTHSPRIPRLLGPLLIALLAPAAALGIELGQLDDFEDNTLAGWRKGANTQNAPQNVESGGPAGSGDNYLENSSTGGVGPDSRQAIINTAQWIGDYTAAGVGEVRLQARNGGETMLFMRIAIEGGPGLLSWFSSTQSIMLPADGQWYELSFGLAEADLTRVTGTQSLGDVLANVTEFRVLSNQAGPNFRGEVVNSVLGLDNVAALAADSDGDGVRDDEDDFPNDPTETTDTDGDGIGNNADTDDDNDGIPDAQDDFPLGRFADARPGSFAFTFIENLARSGVTGGCGGGNYCPNNPVTRAQMAVFLERGMRGSSFSPPPATGTRFLDVPANAFAAAFIEQLAADGITGGCGGGNYCPNNLVTRAQMAVFLERGMRGSSFSPPPATGTRFLDVPANAFAAAFIEQLAADGITGGCGGGNYCPNNLVTRAQMAVFLLRAANGAGFVPPPATGVFSDVPPGSFAANFIEQLAADGITGGCGGGNFCPGAPVTRAQMAVFLVRTFDIVFLPGSLTTAFDSNNGGTGNMFDVATGSRPIVVTSVDVNLSFPAGTDFSIDVYTAPGGYEATITAAPGCTFNCTFDLSDWTLVASGSGVSSGQDLPSFVNVGDFTLPANTTTGVWVFLASGPGLVDQFRYTNGNVAASNADITITPSAGIVGTTPATARIATDRQWNGTLYYLAR